MKFPQLASLAGSVSTLLGPVNLKSPRKTSSLQDFFGSPKYFLATNDQIRLVSALLHTRGSTAEGKAHFPQSSGVAPQCQHGGNPMAANQSIPIPGVIVNEQPLRSETCQPKPASWGGRIEALIDKVFEYAFGDDEKTILNSLHGL
jgi:hypothetical protein